MIGHGCPPGNLLNNSFEWRSVWIVLGVLLPLCASTVAACPFAPPPFAPASRLIQEGDRAAEAEAQTFRSDLTARRAEIIADTASKPDSANSVAVRLRITWGGGENCEWVGSISLNEGTCSSPQPLALTTDASGSVVSIERQLRINHGSPVSFGGVDFNLESSVDAELKIELGDKHDPSIRFDESIKISDLLHSARFRDLDSRGNRLSISRAPGDLLPVTFARKHLVFAPGEPIEFSVKANRTSLASFKGLCRIRFESEQDSPIRFPGNRQEKGESLSFDLDEFGSTGDHQVHLTAPSEEGVHQISVDLTTPWQTASLKPRPSVQRKIQIVVVSPRPIPGDQKPWKRVVTIEPTNESIDIPNGDSNLKRLGARNSNSNFPALGNDQRELVMIDQQSMLKLNPGGWHAIPITFEDVDRPHYVEIEFLASQSTSIGFSLIESDPKGRVANFGIDSGVHVPESLVDPRGESGDKQIQKHRIVFWPRAGQSHLLIANRHSSKSATIGKVEIFSGPSRLPESLESREIEKSLMGGVAQENRRQYLAFHELGVFARNFNAPVAVDEATGQSFDDWTTFYEGVDRFVQYLKAHSYSGAIVSIACDGSALYPSEILGGSLRLDNGQYFASGQDPIRKDVVELMFRMFEREGLTLVPALVMNGPIPSIEQIRLSQSNNSQGMATEIVHWSQSQTGMKSQLPIYNPLSVEVQRAVLSTVDEIGSRYGKNPSFGGLALVCRPDAYTLLPGQQWCYDSDTIARFWNETVKTSEVPSDSGKVSQILLGELQDRWLSWRATQMSNWYRSMNQSLHSKNDRAGLVLAPVEIYRNEELESALAPSLHSTLDFRKQMLRLGWDPDQLASIEGLKLLKPKRTAPIQSMAEERVETGLESFRNADDFYVRAKAAGDLHVNRVSWGHFAQLQETPPFQSTAAPIMRIQPLSPAGIWNCQRFLNTLRISDAHLLVDGGWELATGQEEHLRGLMKIYRQLPAAEFSNVDIENGNQNPPNAPQTLPVVLRHCEASGRRWFYAVNASPWPNKITFKVADENVEPIIIESLDSTRFKLGRDGKQQTVEFEMEPFSLVGGCLQRPVAIANYRFDLPKNGADRLRKQLYSLQSKLLDSLNSTPLNVLKNSNFEFDGQPSLSHWEMGQKGTTGISLDIQSGYESKASLRLQSSEPSPVWVRSNPFPVPATGRVSVSVWLRTEDPSEQPPLRIAVEGTADNSNYYRFGSIGSLSADSSVNQLDKNWQRFAVHFDDLPLERVSQIRIGFDLMGKGTVFVDRVEVYDRWFDERDAKAITQRLASCGPLLSDPKTFETCRQILNGYWLRFLDEHFEEASPTMLAAKKELDEAEADPKTKSGENDLNNADSDSEGRERGFFRRLRRTPNRLPR